MLSNPFDFVPYDFTSLWSCWIAVPRGPSFVSVIVYVAIRLNKVRVDTIFECWVVQIALWKGAREKIRSIVLKDLELFALQVLTWPPMTSYPSQVKTRNNRAICFRQNSFMTDNMKDYRLCTLNKLQEAIGLFSTSGCLLYTCTIPILPLSRPSP